MDLNCSAIQLYTESVLLKSIMATQLTFSLISIIGVLMTSRRIFSSILVDRTFKEYLSFCYAIQLFQSIALFCLQSVLLGTHLTQSPCEATISSTLCYGLRFATTTGTFSLPLLNMSLALMRLQSLFYPEKSSNPTYTRFRVICPLIIGVIFFELWWKYGQEPWPTGPTPYCIGNPKSVAERANLESLIIAIFEIFSIFIGLLLIRLYSVQKRKTRSFDVTINLTRRQMAETMRLFLPYSLFHSLCFVAFSLVSIYYRPIFQWMGEPAFDAFSGLFFFPMYFTSISPMILYLIIRFSEEKRQNSTRSLVSLEKHAERLYFVALREQWK